MKTFGNATVMKTFGNVAPLTVSHLKSSFVR